jgi:hypothetical protein
VIIGVARMPNDTDAKTREIVLLEKEIVELELEIANIRIELQVAETKLARAKLVKPNFMGFATYVAKGAVAIGAAATIVVTVSSYVKSVTDTHATRYHELVEQLTTFGDVTPQNADQAIALLSRLDSEFLDSPSLLSGFVFPIDGDRAFQVAYVIQPFLRVYGEGLDKVGIVAGQLMGKAVSKIDDIVQRDLLVSDSGDLIESISGDFPSSRFLAGLYLAVMLDVQCQIAFLSNRVGRPEVSEESHSKCRRRLESDDPLESGD